MSRSALDFRPLRESPSYRRLYASGFVTSIGSQASAVALAWQLKNLTHSALAVGALGLVEVLPLILAGLYGGVVADHFDRKTIVVATEVLMLLISVGLAINALMARPMAWVIYVGAPLAMVGAALQSPSLGALSQQYLIPELQRSAASLQTFMRSAVSLIGPAIGGLLVVSTNAATVYLIDVVTFFCSLVFLLRISSMGRQRDEGRPTWADFRFGASYAWSRPDIVGSYVVDTAAMVFAYPVLMLPFVADTYHSPSALALMYAAMPAGALLASLTSNIFRNVTHYGRAIVVAATAWGLGIALFGAVHQLAIAVVGLVIAGGADGYSGIYRMSLWNETIPNDVRGRMGGIEVLSYSVGPTMGQFRGGWSISRWGVRTAMAGGGVLSALLTGATPLACRSLWTFKSAVTNS